jgi:hypothetical protein
VNHSLIMVQFTNTRLIGMQDQLATEASALASPVQQYSIIKRLQSQSLGAQSALVNSYINQLAAIIYLLQLSH